MARGGRGGGGPRGLETHGTELDELVGRDIAAELVPEGDVLELEVVKVVEGKLLGGPIVRAAPRAGKGLAAVSLVLETPNVMSPRPTTTGPATRDIGSFSSPIEGVITTSDDEERCGRNPGRFFGDTFAEPESSGGEASGEW